MKTKKVTKDQVKSLRKALGGVGSRKKIDWNKIDYNVGRGVISDKKYCLWTDEGFKITVSVFKDGGIAVSQSKRKDPEYFKLINN
jgi:hypothetical protein